MAEALLTEETLEALGAFLQESKKADFLSAYLFVLERHFHIHPVAVPQRKMIYQSVERAIELLEAQDLLWHEAQIKIMFSEGDVNEETQRVYICPFSGKVFGNNTHPNPQDAIYDWVSKCPENLERSGGLRVKRFYVSEDPEVIKSYIKPRKEGITKTVYSSVLTGKLFASRTGVIEDFKKHHMKRMTLVEVQGQNRFEIEPSFLEFLQNYLDENRVSTFLGELSEHEAFQPHVQQWIEG